MTRRPAGATPRATSTASGACPESLIIFTPERVITIAGMRTLESQTTPSTTHTKQPKRP